MPLDPFPRDAALKLIADEEQWLGVETVFEFIPGNIEDPPQMPSADTRAALDDRRKALATARTLLQLAPADVTMASIVERAIVACERGEAVSACRYMKLVMYLVWAAQPKFDGLQRQMFNDWHAFGERLAKTLRESGRDAASAVATDGAVELRQIARYLLIQPAEKTG